MATDFIMPRLPAEQQHQHPHQHQHQQPNLYFTPTQHQRQQYRAHQQASFHPSLIPTAYPAPTQFSTPVSPLGTPGSTSPTQPKNYITHQNRPLYVPAVLRPTQFPSKEPPARPAKLDDDEDDEDEALRPNSSFMSLGGLSAFGRLSRRSTGDSAKCVNGNWNLDHFPKPTGIPSRKHWKPDQESAMCDHATCKRYFSYFTRRHHCRKCGNIFCDQHSALEIPLDQDANFNPRGVPSRACGHCYAQFKEWRSLATSKPGSRDGSGPGGGPGACPLQLHSPATPLAASPTANPLGHGHGPMPLHPSEVAHSVPRDWNWSTF